MLFHELFVRKLGQFDPVEADVAELFAKRITKNHINNIQLKKR